MYKVKRPRIMPLMMTTGNSILDSIFRLKGDYNMRKRGGGFMPTLLNKYNPKVLH